MIISLKPKIIQIFIFIFLKKLSLKITPPSTLMETETKKKTAGVVLQFKEKCLERQW